jgi:hypothetical protein
VEGPTRRRGRQVTKKEEAEEEVDKEQKKEEKKDWPVYAR